MKAYLEGEANERAYRVYEDMFDKPPKSQTPYWLVRMAIYYGALLIGYARSGRRANGADEKMFACVKQLNENALRNNKVLWHQMHLHDLEPAEFGGRELVE